MIESEMPTVTIEGGPNAGATPDSALPGWLGKLPANLRPYASLARWDRPVGIWLLVLPCWIGIAFTRIGMGWHWGDLGWAALFLIGAVAMRGAGCTWNDLMDRDLDAGVARTAARPLPSGQINTRQAYLWLVIQLSVGLLVWLCLPFDAKIIALVAIALVALYPFMKRWTWWPQAWLGMTFNWGVFIAAATVSYVSLPTFFLWLALIAWTIAYDTIYALQDVEDDALVGVKSTARLFGDRAVLGAFSFHMIAAAIAGYATWTAGAGRLGALTMSAFLLHGIWQALQLHKHKSENALGMFKSNVWAGVILLAGLSVAAMLNENRVPANSSVWNTLANPGLVERDRLRAREALPGWIAEKETEPETRNWPSLSDIFGRSENPPLKRSDNAPDLIPEINTEADPAALPQLPDWLLAPTE